FERIFQPFERVRSPGSTAFGTGLGLTITRLLCDIMGGDISVQSTPGQGSQFKVALLLSSTRGEGRGELPPSQLPRGYVGEPRRILVIDDEDSHRQLMNSLLTPLGFQVTTLANPLLALELVRRQVAYLVLLAANMPGIDGRRLLQRLREPGCRLPVIVLAADVADDGQLQQSGLHEGYS